MYSKAVSIKWEITLALLILLGGIKATIESKK